MNHADKSISELDAEILAIQTERDRLLALAVELTAERDRKVHEAADLALLEKMSPGARARLAALAQTIAPESVTASNVPPVQG